MNYEVQFKEAITQSLSLKYIFSRVMSDVSLQVLLFTNLFTIAIALLEGWGLPTLVWTYWFQSVIIGFFSVIRIINLKNFTTDGIKINNQAVSSAVGKYLAVGFFILHYGLFHLVYFGFLLAGFTNFVESGSPVAWNIVLLTVLMFFCNHLFSYVYNRETDTRPVHVGTYMLLPYLRILPMHLTIIFTPMFSMFVGIPLILFLFLKTLADMATHVVEHDVLGKRA